MRDHVTSVHKFFIGKALLVEKKKASVNLLILLTFQLQLLILLLLYNCYY